MKLTFEGQACFSIEASGVNLLVDPFITGNPLAVKKVEDFRPDIILLTHGHHDHLGDALTIARRCGATIAAQVDLLNALDTEGIDTVAFNLGGCTVVRGIHLIMVPAWHGSTVSTPEGPRYGGVACGFVIEHEDGNLYHAGDTALFGDMGMVIERYQIGCALLPIGDFYTMGPKDAVTAAKWLKAKYVIPMHYNTFPIIQQDVEAFRREVDEKTDSSCVVLTPGESWELCLSKS